MMAARTLFMETTQVDASRSAAEIVAELVKAGATSVNTDYENGQISGLRWVMKIHGVDQLFAMPVRVAPIEKILRSRRKGIINVNDVARLKEQAVRVAWRQLLRWTQAQMALVQTGMAETGEVFFAYIQAPSGQTIFEAFANQGTLPAGDDRPRLLPGRQQ